MSATHRYVARDGQAFFVRLIQLLDRNYCPGSNAIVLTVRGGTGVRVLCPMCGVISAISPSNEVWPHYGPYPARTIHRLNRERRQRDRRVRQHKAVSEAT